MNIKRVENEMEEKILEFLIQPRFKNDIQKAKEYFYEKQNNITENIKRHMDFNSWLIHDYILENGKTIFEEYFEMYKEQFTESQRKFAMERIAAFLSLYELKEISGAQGLLRDIFTKNEIWVEYSEIGTMEIGDLILARAVFIDSKYRLIDIKSTIPRFFRSTIEKSIFPKYEEYKNKEVYGNWEDFLKLNSLLLISHIEIIMNLIEEQVAEDAKYDVWQSVYFITDSKQIFKIFSDQSKIKLDFEEDNIFYFKWYEQDGILAEMVLKPETLEIECISEEERKKAKKNIEYLLGNLVIHYKDELIGFNDII